MILKKTNINTWTSPLLWCFSQIIHINLLGQYYNHFNTKHSNSMCIFHRMYGMYIEILYVSFPI